jgi:hypothetical protein
VIVGLVEQPTAQRVAGAVPIRIRRRDLEHRLARAATQGAVGVVQVLDTPAPTDCAQVDGGRQPFAAQRAALRELSRRASSIQRRFSRTKASTSAARVPRGTTSSSV